MDINRIVKRLREKECHNLAGLIEDLEADNKKLREELDGKSRPNIRCRYCGGYFYSVGHTDQYQHNWIKCKEFANGLQT